MKMSKQQIYPLNYLLHIGLMQSLQDMEFYDKFVDRFQDLKNI